jgi:pimeloyl-ACP methyl ester carboxylesterase
MVAFAFVAQYRDRASSLTVIDAPVPGIGPWEEVLKNPLLWHFRFGGPDMERLVAGRERIYLDRFWNEFSATPARFTEDARQHYSKLYAQPGAMRAGFAQFAAFDQDALDDKAYIDKGGKLQLPVYAVGGEKSFGATMAVVASEQTHRVRLSFAPGALRLSVETPDLGEAREEMEVQYDGEPLDIGFNATYLLEVLRYIPTDEVAVAFRAPERAATLQPHGSPDGLDYLCLVMPLRLLD